MVLYENFFLSLCIVLFHYFKIFEVLMNTLLVLLVIFLALGTGGYIASKKKKAQVSVIDAKLKELGIRGFLESGKYITGHSKIITPNISTMIYIKDDNIHIVSKSANISELGIIPLKDVINVLVEDASTIEKRVTATRFLAIGLFAFAVKKKEKTEIYYVTIVWNDGKFEQQTIFEFAMDPKLAKVIQNPAQEANILKGEILNRANALEK
jgi:hypothetical protein